MKRKRIPLESAIEAKFLRKAKSLPVKIRKINGLGFRSWPDRLIIGPMGFVMWIEFKRPEIGKLSEGQKELFEEFGLMDHPVLVSDDADQAFDELVRRLKEHGVDC